LFVSRPEGTRFLTLLKQGFAIFALSRFVISDTEERPRLTARGVKKGSAQWVKKGSAQGSKKGRVKKGSAQCFMILAASRSNAATGNRAPLASRLFDFQIYRPCAPQPPERLPAIAA
jgi:hypothetical protein